MALASSLQKVAAKVISTFGQTVTVQFFSYGSYNPETGAMVKSSSNSEIKGILQDITEREVNELVQATDKKLLVAKNALTSVPNTEDKVSIGGTVYQVIEVKTEQVQGSNIYYELILRG